MSDETLADKLNASATGQALQLGQFAFPILDFDPNISSQATPQVWGDGGAGIYNRSGTLELWAFTRETGWQQVT